MDDHLNLLHHVEATVPAARGVHALFRQVRPDDDPTLWHSTLNNDGTPFQIAIADTGDGHRSVRLIVDPFRLGRDEVDRQGSNLAAFAQLQSRCSARAADRCRRFMAMLAPSFEQVSERRSGDIWLAADPSRAGVAIYVTARSRSPDEQAERLIAEANIDQHRAAVTAIHAVCTVQAYSMQGSRTGNLSVNIYWKPPVGMQSIPREIGFDLPLWRFGSHEGALSRASAGALTFCSTFAVTGDGRGSKLDLCNHCLGLDAQGCLATLDQFCAISSGFADNVAHAAAAQTAEIAFLGVRMRAGENAPYVYLKPVRHGATASAEYWP
ncbi:hypothetical protein FSB78_14290 [Sphingomonas ginsenosidivorax]|uniref:Uncharacterized protein n=1 Tax=Sphingomonas ginsenosidivorax TaxID=862135 RepID=A0A5C6UGV4_9SPHN|nr:hypothetical protein [Sphingomonas ginsenosidivorax]TXC71993.1 hypothetical protein FSB78_14290 [Sphingomonas ginsenosidivorax]